MQEAQEMWVQSLRWEDPLEKGMATHSSILAWRIPWTEEPGGLQSMGLKRVGHKWSDLACVACVSSAKKMPTDSSRTLVEKKKLNLLSVQFSSVAQSCPTLCDPMNHSTPGLPVHHHLPEFTGTHVHQVSDTTQPSHPLSSPSPPAPNPSQHQSLFQWVNSSHEMAKVLEFQL